MIRFKSSLALVIRCIFLERIPSTKGSPPLAKPTGSSITVSSFGKNLSLKYCSEYTSVSGVMETGVGGVVAEPVGKVAIPPVTASSKIVAVVPGAGVEGSVGRFGDKFVEVVGAFVTFIGIVANCLGVTTCSLYAWIVTGKQF